MFLKNINVQNFRNYADFNLELVPGINIIYGNNAQGKTNLLESIYVLGLTKSHRSFIDNNLIKNEENNAYLKGRVSIDEIDYVFEIGINQKQKKLKLDNNQIKKVSDYVSKINLLIFYPEDLNLIKGSPKDRRRFLNLEIGQLDSNYLDIVSDYNKLLKMRNDLLKKKSMKEKIDENYFQILTKYLIDKAASIHLMRNKFVNKINEHSNYIYKDILGIDGFYLKYIDNLKLDKYELKEIISKLESLFIKEQNNEIRLGSTLIGPHRDDLEFYIEKENLKYYGSQGQQRVAILTVKLSEIEIFKKYRGENPILLLDDVFSELDDIKKNNLLKYIDNGMQVIITTTELTNIDKRILDKSKKIKIENATIVSEEEVK